MTLIVGIKCSDGIVMGADGAATLGTADGAQTVIQPTTKLRVLQKRMIMGVSGQVGLGQLYCDAVEDLWKTNKLGKNASLAQVRAEIEKSIFMHVEPATQRAQSSIPFLGNSGAFNLINTASLIALPVGGVSGKPELIQCMFNGQTELATKELPYVAVGSGQAIADPFLGFLRRIFWPDTLLSVADGIFAVTWTLLHAIAVNAGGVAEPVQLTVLEKAKGNELSAKELSEVDIEEHRQNIQAAEEHLKRFKEFPDEAGQSPPKAPVKG